MTKEYIEATFEDVLQLAPSAVKDSRNHEIHIFRPWRPGHAGSELVAALVDSDKRVSIADDPKRNHTGAWIWRDATNGVGADAYVYFHRDDPPIPTVQSNGRVIEGKLTYLDGSGKKKTIPQDKEELRTIGLGQYRDGLTENALRREHDLPRRGAHDFGKKK